MINFYKTINGVVTSLEEMSEGAWISVIKPTNKETSFLVDELKIDSSYITSALDEEESSRIESYDGQTLIIIDYPIADKDESLTILYRTISMGIIITDQYFITISIDDNPIINDLVNGTVKNVNTHMKTRLLLMLMFRIANKFIQFLKQIDKISLKVEKELHKSLKNKELIQLLGLSKSLVFFSTSLKGIEITLEKILRGRFLKLYEDDQDLLQDVLIEIKQAVEMSTIYSNILSGVMDAFASIISNNLNIVMKVLTSITIVMAIPTMIASFYGMNVEMLPLPNFYVPLVLSVIATLTVSFVLIKKGMFK